MAAIDPLSESRSGGSRIRWLLFDGSCSFSEVVLCVVAQDVLLEFEYFRSKRSVRRFSTTKVAGYFVNEAREASPARGCLSNSRQVSMISAARFVVVAPAIALIRRVRPSVP